MQTSPLDFLNVKGVALPVHDIERANKFYRDILSLPKTDDDNAERRYLLGQTILMLKSDWYAAPTDMPNPRITLEVRHAPNTEKELRARGVVISDPVERYDDSYIGSFLDSEGNKLWFCSSISQGSA
jgi:predicted enzyme related to lactoylglutathione lyase